jgi:hypothetical protein
MLENYSQLEVVLPPQLAVVDLLALRLLWVVVVDLLLHLLVVRLLWVENQRVDHHLGKISQNIATCMQEFLEQHILKVQKHLYLKK